MAKKEMTYEQYLEMGLAPELARRVADGAKLSIPELEELQLKLQRQLLIRREERDAHMKRFWDIEAMVQELQVPKDKPLL